MSGAIPLKKAKEKPFSVKSRRQEKALLYGEQPQGLVPLTFPLVVDLRFSYHQFIMFLIISDSMSEVRCFSFVDSRYVYSTTHKLMDEHLVVHSTH